VTERKPPGVRHEDWIERQIREAQERGDFDNLRGAGKPLTDLHRPFTAERWAADYITREGRRSAGDAPAPAGAAPGAGRVPGLAR
jgi:Domain of unknown function (DUF1992)